MAKRVRFAKNPRYVSITAAGRYAGVSRWVVTGWVNNGTLPFHRLPGAGQDPKKPLKGVKIDLDDMDQLMQQSKDRNA